MTLSVREATGADTGALVRIAELMYSEMGIETHPAWRAEAISELESRLGKDVVGFLVDDGAGRIVSAGIGLVTHRMPSPDDLAGRFGYIQWVATVPEWRGRGCARAVVSALVEWFRVTRVPSVELHATRAGEPLYRSLGFDNQDRPGLRLRVR